MCTNFKDGVQFPCCIIYYCADFRCIFNIFLNISRDCIRRIENGLQKSNWPVQQLESGEFVFMGEWLNKFRNITWFTFVCETNSSIFTPKTCRWNRLFFYQSPLIVVLILTICSSLYRNICCIYSSIFYFCCLENGFRCYWMPHSLHIMYSGNEIYLFLTINFVVVNNAIIISSMTAQSDFPWKHGQLFHCILVQ